MWKLFKFKSTKPRLKNVKYVSLVIFWCCLSISNLVLSLLSVKRIYYFNTKYYLRFLMFSGEIKVNSLDIKSEIWR